MIDKLTGKRLYLCLVITFAMTWTSWWALATAFRSSDGVFAHPFSTLLFVIGALGPTVAAIVAVALTPTQGTLREYASRLFRWRISPMWWLAALAIPPAMGWLVEHIDLLSVGSNVRAPPLQPFSQLAMLFPLMIVGGGLALAVVFYSRYFSIRHELRIFHPADLWDGIHHSVAV
jgi:hypothetical protein